MIEYHSENFSIKLTDGIVHVTWLSDWVDYQIIDEGVKNRLAITQKNAYPMLSDITLLKGATRDARVRLGAEDGLIGIKALAVIYKNKVHVILYKLFNLFHANSIPTKFFKSKSQAIKWLLLYK